jgi:putative peptidyl-prolyl cis-trans isomerase
MITAVYTASGSNGEYYDGVIAVVNGYPIVNSDVQRRFEQMKRAKKIPANRVDFEISRVLDKYIEDALVLEVANKESLIVSDDKVVNNLERPIKDYLAGKISDSKELESTVKDVQTGLKNRKNGIKVNEKIASYVDDIVKKLEDKEKLSYDILFEEMRSQIRKELVMSVAIGITPPSKKEVKKWYDKNKDKVGFEVRVQHILVRPKGGGLTAEKTANETISGIRKRAMAGESFDALARKYSEDPGSAGKGGDIGWTELHTLDPYFANTVYRMNVVNQISPVFKSSFGYHIVKFLGKRATSMDKIERMIMYKLYSENMMDQYNKWMQNKKRTSDIKIFMKNYKRES